MKIRVVVTFDLDIQDTDDLNSAVENYLRAESTKPFAEVVNQEVLVEWERIYPWENGFEGGGSPISF
jgi:hypothetical protein